MFWPRVGANAAKCFEVGCGRSVQVRRFDRYLGTLQTARSASWITFSFRLFRLQTPSQTRSIRLAPPPI